MLSRIKKKKKKVIGCFAKKNRSLRLLQDRWNKDEKRISKENQWFDAIKLLSHSPHNHQPLPTLFQSAFDMSNYSSDYHTNQFYAHAQIKDIRIISSNSQMRRVQCSSNTSSSYSDWNRIRSLCVFPDLNSLRIPRGLSVCSNRTVKPDSFLNMVRAMSYYSISSRNRPISRKLPLISTAPVQLSHSSFLSSARSCNGHRLQLS